RYASKMGVLRLDVPEQRNAETLEGISWDAFFEKFDEDRLALIYQERTGEGKYSSFHRLVGRDQFLQ
ncbi:MAG: hypothetical protein ACREIA_12715, partial [Opitutaceae bacterium]